MMGIHSGAPVRMFNVVADTTDGAVALHLTLWSHEEVWTVAFNGSLGSIDQWQAIGDGVLTEAVLLGHVARGLLNDGAEVADILGDEMLFGCR